MVAFEREDLFSAKFADSHEVAVMAGARGSTWSKAFDFYGEGKLTEEEVES